MAAMASIRQLKRRSRLPGMLLGVTLLVPDLTPIEILAFSHLAPTNGAPRQNLFLFGGQADQRFTLDRTTGIEPTAWSASPALEIFDPSGILYYLETVTGTNQPVHEYFRATLLP